MTSTTETTPNDESPLVEGSSDCTNQPLPEPPPPQILPGLDDLGRGILAIPGQENERKIFLMDRGTMLEKPRYLRVNKESYFVYQNTEVNEMPEVPAGLHLNQTVVAENFDQISQTISSNIQAKQGNGASFMGFNSSIVNRFSQTNDSYYSIKSSFTPLWKVYFPKFVPLNHVFEQLLAIIPDQFYKFIDNHPYEEMNQQKNTFDYIFSTYGTHYVASAWLGGWVNASFITAKSTEITLNEVRTAVNSSFLNASSSDQQATQRVISNSEINIDGIGGDPTQLARLAGLSPELYEKWFDTVPQSPGIIELESYGLWMALSNYARENLTGAAFENAIKKAGFLAQAYQYISEYKPVTNIVRTQSMDISLTPMISMSTELQSGGNTTDKLLITRSNFTMAYKLPPSVIYLKSRVENQIDVRYVNPFKTIGAFNCILKLDPPDVESTLWYVFLYDQYRIYNPQDDSITEPYPIQGEDTDWPGLTFPQIDTAFYWGDGKAYFFYTGQFVRYDLYYQCVDPGYPKTIAESWEGVIFKRIEASLVLGRWLYLFSGEYYLIYDMNTFTTLPDFPKQLFGVYFDDWAIPLPPVY